MRILLLSCNTGGGHNSAAAAIRSYCEQRGIECDTRDALLFVSKPHSEVISNGHVYIYRHLPQLFGIGYRFEEKHQPRFLYDQMALGAKKFAAYLGDHSYDAIICTHLFGNMLVTEARKRYGVTLPHYAVITDYAMYPGTDMVDAHRYFIAAEQLRDAHLQAGVPNEKLVVSGIPIGKGFLNAPDKQTARRNLGLPEEGKVVLLFSGSIGCGKLNRKAPELEKQLPESAHLVIICGNNSRLFKQLTELCGPKTTVVGYTDRVAEYMAAADLCITKPGGLSTTEMLAVGLPMVLMLSVPGCETHNLRHFEELGVAVGTDDWEKALSLAVELINDDERLTEMRGRLLSIGYPGGAKVIVDTVLADIARQESDNHD